MPTTCPARILPSAPFEFWDTTAVAPTARSLSLLGGSAICLIAGSVLGLAAVRVSELGFVAPFRYAALPFALVAGFVLFGERPDSLALAGSALVIAGGLITLCRRNRGASTSPG